MHLTIILFLSFLPLASHSDSWPPAKPISAIDTSGKYVLKTYPGDDLGSVWGFAGEKKGKNAKFEVYRFNQNTRSYDFLSEFISNNPISPVYVFISKYGNITTIDNWHNTGIGKVITIYTFRGTIKNSFTLKQIYNEKELKKIHESTSSLHWRCSEPFFNKLKDAVIIEGFNKDLIIINPNKGSFIKEQGFGTCK